MSRIGIHHFVTAAVVAGAMFMPAAGRAAPIAAAGTEGLEVVVATTGEVIARYEGTTASYTNLLFLDAPGAVQGAIFNNQATPVGAQVSLGTFTAGTVLRFSIEVLNTGDVFYSGAAALNADSHAHARVQSNYAPGTTLVSFEDLFNGAFHFNDLSFTFTNTTSARAVPTPEPATLALLGSSLFGLAGIRRFRAGQARTGR